MRVGVDYYPEHWPESRWPEDARLMREAGLSVVRLAEFAWCRMEPVEGLYDFGWLERALDVLRAEGIVAVLGTPTATPPAWLHERYPDLYPADARRYRLGFGTRLQRCLGNPIMRDYSRRITEAMARHFGEHPAVIGWQTDNEFEANLCYCDGCAQRFRDWLRARYGTLDALNAAWGTVFWSQEYSGWSQIPLPWEARCGKAHNPSLQLDWRRFASETSVTFQREQVEILRRHSPGRFVTHNMMGLHDSLDYFDLAADLDFIAWDNYPGGDWNPDWEPGMTHDVMRGVKRRPFWIMEEQSGIPGWDRIGVRPADGQVRTWSWQAVAHGADAVLFFRWRSCLYGTEQYWHGILNHDGQPRRRYREIARFAREASELAPLLDGTQVRAQAAILSSYEQNWALQIQPQVDGLAWWEQSRRYHGALRRQGLAVDVVSLAGGLHGYRLVCAPSWYVLTDEDAARLTDYVRGGGTLLVSPRTGVKDVHNACRPQALPSLLAELAGVEVDDYAPLGRREVKVRAGDGAFTGSVWADALLPRGGEVIATYADGHFAGEPAIVRNRFGAGTVFTFGVYGEPALYDAVLPAVLDAAGIEPGPRPPEGVDMLWREKPGVRLLFVVNQLATPVAAPAPWALDTLLGPSPADGAIALAPYEVGVYREAG